MKKFKRVVWRSKSDRDLFNIGIRYMYGRAASILGPYEQYAVFTVSTRQLQDIFGQEVAEQLLRLSPGETREIELDLRLKSAL